MMDQYFENGEEELLDFDRAMLDFRAMFPQIRPEQIELVLRKYDGDVSATINELLFDNTASPTSVVPVTMTSATNSGNFSSEEDRITRLRRRRDEINKKLVENQMLLDKVTDVESARIYEDQQLAYLLEYREVKDLIKEEKTKILAQSRACAPSQSRRNVQMPEARTERTSLGSKKKEERKAKKTESNTYSGRSSMNLEERVPDGPYIGPEVESEGGTSDLAARIKGTFKKASGSRLSRLFSTP